MLIPSSWHFIELWFEEEQYIQSVRTMEQILFVSEINYIEDSKRYIKMRSRASYNKMVQIVFYGTTIHRVPLIWEGYNQINVKSNLQELF